MPTKVRTIEIIAGEAAKRADCLITTVRLPVNRYSYMIVFQPPIRAVVEVSGALLDSSFPNDLVTYIAQYMKQTTDGITTYLNRINDGTVEEEREITIEFSMGAESPLSPV